MQNIIFFYWKYLKNTESAQLCTSKGLAGQICKIYITKLKLPFCLRASTALTASKLKLNSKYQEGVARGPLILNALKFYIFLFVQNAKMCFTRIIILCL